MPAPAATVSAAGASELWATRYNGTGNDDDFASDVAVSPDGSSVFVTGLSLGSASVRDWDYATTAYDASTGAEMWARRYAGSGNDWDVPTALGVSPDGSAVYVTGASTGTTSGFDAVTVAYDAATGASLWEKRYDSRSNDADANDDSGDDLAVSPDGSVVFVTGESSRGGSMYITMAIDAATGRKLWLKRYNDAVNDVDNAWAIVVSPDGSAVFVSGTNVSEETERNDWNTVAYDASTGAMLWAERHNGPLDGQDQVYALGVSPDGSTVFATGTSADPFGRATYATVAFDATTGAEVWARRYRAAGTRVDFASSLSVSPDGSAVFMTGTSVGSATTEKDWVTVAYGASTGALLWAKRYNGRADGSDWAGAVATSPDGSTVFVNGSRFGSRTSDDLATVAYDADTGTRLWVKTYNGRANRGDGGGAISVSSDGSRLFVTGTSFGAARYDYITLAYVVE